MKKRVLILILLVIELGFVSAGKVCEKDVNSILKEHIFYLKDNSTIHLTEGENILSGDYLVFPPSIAGKNLQKFLWVEISPLRGRNFGIVSVTFYDYDRGLPVIGMSIDESRKGNITGWGNSTIFVEVIENSSSMDQNKIIVTWGNDAGYNNVGDETSITCLYGCENGACIDVSCTDSDNGVDFSTQGSLTIVATDGKSHASNQYGEPYTDTCNNGRIVEYSCNESAINLLCPFGCNLSKAYNCPSGEFCSDGKCINTPCTENWQCTSWSQCQNSITTRTCTDLNNCGTSANKPATNQTCTIGACIENWNCTSWSYCFWDGMKGLQVRTCIDLNECGTGNNFPQMQRACHYAENITQEIINQTNITVTTNSSGLFVSVKNTSSIGGVEVKIERSSGVTRLLIESLEIKSEVELVEKEHKVYVKTANGEREIKVIPSDAIASAKKIDTVESIKIEEYKGKPVYSISGTKKARLFFIIPITADVTQKINLEDGKIVSTEKPWWHFLALGV